ncbi:uncharacterized protein LOC126790862 isoform X2 [Argentina anserina]|uniref:uncharacterized protein LOC126790862 isoform X2 n=1 Tax=Argentina anserina TaxID=57926 RepID=UPI0021764717|nr:uncharacterized protein LOC126790862 isoform X2 [Potentilla anserina]
MDHKDLRRAQSSGQEGHGVHVCHKCGWPYPNPHPSAKHRRAHKKICGSVEGYKVLGSQQLSVSDGEQNSDDEPKTPSPKVVERSVFEKGSGGIGQGSMQSDDGVFLDAVAEFSDSGSAVRTAESGAIVKRGEKADLNAIPFRNIGETTDTSDEMKKINVTDSMMESGLTSVDQEAEVTGITTNNLDRNISSEISSMSDSRTEESVLPGDSNSLHPTNYEMVTDPSEAIQMAGDTEFMTESCLTSIDQNSEVSGITATNLYGNMILPNKVAGEPLEGGSKLEESNEMSPKYVRVDEVVPSEEGYSDGFGMHIPHTDVTPEVESALNVNTSADTAEKVDNMDSGKVVESHYGKEDENANLHVISVPDDLHVVKDPVAMLEDFRNPKGKQLDRFVSCSDSWERFDNEEKDVKQPVLSESLSILLSSHLSGGTFVSSDIHDLKASLQPNDGSSIPMIKSVPVEGEASLLQSEVKMFKSQSSDAIGAPAEVMMPQNANISVVGFPEGEESNDKSNESLKVTFAASDDGIDQTTQSVGPNDNEKDRNCDGTHVRGESGDDSKKGPAEENLVNPVATVQLADCYESQIYPAANLHIDDDASDYDKGIIENCNKIGDGGFNDKADSFNVWEADKSKEATEKSSPDPASNLESISCLSKLQLNPVTSLHERGEAARDYVDAMSRKSDFTGYDGDHEKAEKYASSGEDFGKRSIDGTFVGDLTTNFESVIADSQVHPEKKLPDVNGSEKFEKFDDGEIENFVISGNESVDGSLEENILVKSELIPESSVSLSKAVVEDATDGLELVETSSRDVDVSLNSSKVAGKILSDTLQDVLESEIASRDKIQMEVDAGPDHGQNAESFQKNLEDHENKEPGFSALDTESSVQSFIASEDSVPRVVPAVASAITSQSLLEEGDDNLNKQQPSPTAIDMDSNSQTDSLEANWGSFSVLSMQSDAEVLPNKHSQASLEENSDLKKSNVESGSQYSDKSDMFEAPSFMTLVEPRGADDKKATGSETLTAVPNPEQPKPVSLQTGWFPSMTHVVNESQGRKKNEEIIAKVTNWSTGKQHTPLKNLMGEASTANKGKPPNPEESLAPAPQKDDKAAKVSGPVTTTVHSILNPESPIGEAAKKEHAKEWNSPARYPSDTKSGKKKVKGRSWVQFVCCASVN